MVRGYYSQSSFPMEVRGFCFFSLLHFQQTFREKCGCCFTTALLHLETYPTGTSSCPKSRQEPAVFWGWEGVFGKGHGTILPPCALAQLVHNGLGLSLSHSPQYIKGTFLSSCGVGQPELGVRGKIFLRAGLMFEGLLALGMASGLHRLQLCGWVTLEPLPVVGSWGVQTPCGVAPHLAADGTDVLGCCQPCQALAVNTAFAGRVTLDLLPCKETQTAMPFSCHRNGLCGVGWWWGSCQTCDCFSK